MPCSDILRRSLVALWLPFVVLAAVPAASADDPGALEQALGLYDQQRYEEARAILEQLDADGTLGGTMLYRLSFCQRVGGDAREQATLARAVEALAGEVEQASNLEPAFYLVNAYLNLGRQEPARAAAAAATGRIDSGELTVADDPLEWFRAGKLYADRGAREQATDWFGRAATAFREHPERYPAYLAWAQNYLDRVAATSEDWNAVASRLEQLADTGSLTGEQYDQLGVAQARLGDFAAAQQAWTHARGAPGFDANRANYCRQLSARALALGELPPHAPDGRAWIDWSRTELEALMAEGSGRVRELRSYYTDPAGESDPEGGQPPPPPSIEQARAEIAKIKPVFVAAAMEYALRRLPIRETAFFGGYAPMIFNESAWEIAEP